MQYWNRPLAGICALALASGAIAQPTKRQQVETAFDAGISTKEMLGWMKNMSSAPNHVGSPHNKANAEYMLGLFKSWGWDARIETFSVLYPTPISTTVEMITPEIIKLGGQEPLIPGSGATSYAGALVPYLAYQGDGDVTADLVYLNYGAPDDYEALARRGIDVRGKIVITRYGGGVHRGLKPQLAQEHGAVGCIIYSDPAEDGYAVGEMYPKGGARPPHGVQRGSVSAAGYPGDPLTPGVGATAGAKRLTHAEGVPLKIPTLPMSYGDASKLLAKLGGPVVPSGWQGALPFTYHVGGKGDVKVHLAVKSKWAMTDIHDVVAVMKGSVFPDEWVVRGNHRDGWGMAAVDPLSGSVAMMSEMKAIGLLVKQGWRPKRTLVYGSWDAEEAGLIGSTEWAEAHADELKAKALIYINTDATARGFLYAGGSHNLQHLLNGVAADVTDPETGVSVLRRAQAETLVTDYETKGRYRNPPAVTAARKGADMPLIPLGSGSDYSAFLQHLGLPSLDLGFGFEIPFGGTYHSLYDDYQNLTTYNDPGMAYSATLAKIAGRLALRMADAETPPLRFGDLADNIATYLAEVKALADGRRERDTQLGKLLADDSFRLASDPLNPVSPPPAVTVAAPKIDFSALESAIGKLKTSAAAFDSAYLAQDATLLPASRTKLNAMLRDIDQLLLDKRGLPGRPWYRNMIYAPGRFTGYGAKTLPGIREAIEERRFSDATTYVGITAQVIDAYASRLDQARSILESK